MAASPWNRKSPISKENIMALVGSSSIVVKCICFLVVTFYCISFSKTASSYLCITPGSLLPPNFYIIPLVTSCFVELHFWDVVIDLFILVLCGKLLEPLWGALEMLLFFILTNISVSIILSLVYLLVYASTSNTDYLFETKIYGLVGYIAGFSVAVKQIMAEHVLVTFMDIKLRNRHIPLCVFALAILLWLVGLLRSTYPCMYGTGICVTWIYLRFYQRHSNGTKGDMADGFSFASFFPDVMQKPVAVISNTIFNILVQLKICKKIVRKYDISSPTAITIDIPGATQDTERRRQKALKALNERLKEKEPEWPCLDDQPGDESKGLHNESNQPMKAMVSVHSPLPDTDIKIAQPQNKDAQVPSTATNQEST